MGKPIIREEFFPEIVELYNTEGKVAAYEYLRNRYKIKQPYFVICRIRDSGRYIYDHDNDRFSAAEPGTEENLFMGIDELCSASAVTQQKASPRASAVDRSTAMEKLVHELINDRLLTLSRYIVLDSSTRTVHIDRTSLSTDGYQVVTH